MMKLICIVKRLPELSYEEFLDHWCYQHADLIKKYADVLGINRYVQSQSIESREIQSQMTSLRNMTDFDFDGIAELWYPSLEIHLNSRNTLEGAQALEEIIADEKRFIDLSRSRMWYSCEYTVL
ncbi:EthD domain-containing protein [Vibrio mangrovi]|uniref:EthD domain-containing protein n=1 Tax=Vibrio mangrovi TaxID=474394 RepID=A0A1Y6ITS4_9VIBR|nr:EthD domain-containing protein [Vibrio mangrovi]MDW6004747.1 EthD domain-containing protein [Vibrio mangrovi]SMS01038.1 hypothetical protein VIM7927_02315 [Vibrio mangrovi]